MVRKELLQDAQEVVSSALLGEGIKVVFDARGMPYADLANRVMHLRPLPDEVDERALIHLRADCDHEMGHFGASDPAVMESVTRPLVKLALNAIEDGFVERWVSSRWVGCAENLDASNREVFAEIRANATSDVDNKRARALNALMLLARGEGLEGALATVGNDVRPILDEIAELVPEIQQVANTAKARDLAERIIDRWRWGNAPTKKPTTPKQGAHEKSEEKLARERARARRPSKSKVSDDSPRKEDESEDAAERYRRSPSFREQEDKVARKLEQSSVGARRKAKIASVALPRGAYRAYTEEDVVERLDGSVDSSDFLESVRGVVPVLRRRLLMEFRGVGTRIQHDLRHGEIDRSALHQVAFGSDRIFQREVPESVVDADVTLLVDCSGSMTFTTRPEGPTRLYVAAQAACAFSLVLDLIGVSHECLAFTTTAHYGRANTAIEPRGPYQRVRPLRHLILKDARQSFREARGAFACLSEWEGTRENVDGEAVLWAARRLVARNRPGMKPFLIVFSDGEPASVPERMQTLSQHLEKTVARVEAAGVTVLGVGIQTEAVARYYKHHVVIRNVTDLVGTSYELIRSTLRSARATA